MRLWAFLWVFGRDIVVGLALGVVIILVLVVFMAALYSC